MNPFVIGFIVGVFVGGLFGMVIMAALAMGSIDDDRNHRDIPWLGDTE